jgi:hypothetical protein
MDRPAFRPGEKNDRRIAGERANFASARSPPILAIKGGLYHGIESAEPFRPSIRETQAMRIRPIASSLLAVSLSTPFACAHAEMTVRIGQVSPLTGELAHIGKDDENGVRLAIEDLNAKRIQLGGTAGDLRARFAGRRSRSENRGDGRAKAGR